MRWLLWPATVVFVIQACAASEGGNDPGGNNPGSSIPGSGDVAATPAPSPQPSGSIALPTRFLDPIVTDAARRAGVDAGAVTVIRAEPRTWGDSSLGCPEPGMYYTQVTVEGYQVIVVAGGREYDYHGGAGRFVVCEGGVPAR